jgi:hypothetical protein
MLVKDTITQLIRAVNSFCGKSEDKEMENEIFELIIEKDETIRAALDIGSVVNIKSFDKRARDMFKEDILNHVKKEFPDARPGEEEGNLMIQVPIPVIGGAYILDVYSDWRSIFIEVDVDKEKRNSKYEERMVKEITKYTNGTIVPENNCIFAISWTNQYPFEKPVDKDLYLHRLCKLYAKQPQEAAGKIIEMVNALKNVIA